MSTREFRLPDLGEGLTESDVVSWRVAVGDEVALNQVIAEVETAKALVELPSPVAGVVARLHADAGTTVAVGEPLVTFEVADGEPAAAAPSQPAPASEPESEPAEPNLVGYGARPERAGRPVRRPRRDVAPPTRAAASPAPGRVRATPPVRVLARREGVDLTRVVGTGPAGAVTREDVAAAAHGSAGSRSESRERVQGVRRRTAEAMVHSAFTAPHATVWTTVDATATTELLERLRADRATAAARITVLAAVARATCLALRRHPDLNATWADEEIVRFGYVDLGVAVATDRGLLVPHLPDADRLGLPELADALGTLVDDARHGRSEPARLSGGTFTITNVGVFDVDGGTPILVPGQSGILAVGAVRRRPWEHDGAVALRDVVTLAVSFDHRVADGEQAARFLAEVGALLGDPGRALLIGDRP